MKSKRYTEEFKREAVKQITERGYSVADVAQRLGTTTHSLYAWLKKFDEPNPLLSGKVISLPRMFGLSLSCGV
jgi:transposase